MRWYPQTGLGSKFNSAVAELSIPDEYQKFLDRFEHVVLIAFGTTFMPKEKDILNILEGAKLADASTTGFIVSIKETESSYQKI
jgi:hypothetical protein